MKPYSILLLAVFLLLMMIPLPALGILQEDKPPPSATSSASAEESAPSSASSPAVTATFKVMDVESEQVVELSERDFLIGTVACEMYPTYHMEALKAQAVAAYTYYSRKRTAARSKPAEEGTGADFSDVPSKFPKAYTVEDMKERWGNNYETYYKKISEAVDAVAGQRILYDGQHIMAMYHAINAGTTETYKNVWGGEDYPYLQSVPSPGDKLSPGYESTVSFTAAEFSDAMTKSIKDLTLTGDGSTWLTGEPERSPAGTITAVKLGGSTVTGKQIRGALGLRSSSFTVAYVQGSFRFVVQGFGHGVGMSQYGADYLARQGSGYKEILQYYYTKVTVE